MTDGEGREESGEPRAAAERPEESSGSAGAFAAYAPMVPVAVAFFLAFLGIWSTSWVRAVEDLRPLAADAIRGTGFDDVDLLLALVHRESRGNPQAHSSAGALGLTQLKPAAASDAAARLGEPPPKESDLLDPRTSLRLGASYLKLLIDRYQGAVDVALAAYWKGPGWVDSVGGVPAVRRWLQQPGDLTYYVTRILDLAEKMRTRDGR